MSADVAGLCQSVEPEHDQPPAETVLCGLLHPAGTRQALAVGCGQVKSDAASEDCGKLGLQVDIQHTPCSFLQCGCAFVGC